MKNKTKVVLFILFLSAFIMAISFGGQKAKWKGTIEEEDGVKVIKNPGKPLYGEIELKLEVDLSIGGEDVDENYMFRRVSDIEVDEEGNIYVLDSIECRIQKYDKDGKYLKTIGRKGEGPGEFQRASSMYFDSEGKLYVNEFRKIHIFEKNGVFEKTIIPKSPLSNFGVTKKGSIFGHSYTFTEEGATMDIMIMDSEGKRTSTVANFPESTASVQVGRGVLMTTPPYSPGLYFCPLNNESGIYGYSAEYKLFFIKSSGEIVYRIDKDEKRQRTSKKEESDYVKERAERQQTRGGQLSEGDLRKLYKFAKYKPFFTQIINDDEGHLFLAKPKSVLKEEIDTYFDVFSIEGHYLYKIKIHEVKLHIIKKGCLYTYRQDEDTGYYKIERYKIKNWSQIKKEPNTNLVQADSPKAMAS